MPKYKIEGHGQGGDWSEDYVGNDTEANTFDTEKIAEEMIPGLAQMFECEENDFRVVERPNNEWMPTTAR